MLTAKEQDLQRKRDDMQNEDVKSQKAAQFALDVSRHIEDSKQKDFWRKSQLANKEGNAAGELGQGVPGGYTDPGVQEYAQVGHLEGQAGRQRGLDYKMALENLRMQGRAGLEGTKYGYRSNLQEDKQAFEGGENELNRLNRTKNAGIMAGGQNARSALDRNAKAKQATAELYLGIIKSSGQLAQMTEPERMRALEQLMMEANADAQDPNISPEAHAAKWRARASGVGSGGAPAQRPTTAGEINDPSQLP